MNSIRHLQTNIVPPLYSGYVKGSPHGAEAWNCFIKYHALISDLYKRKAVLQKIVEAI